MKPDEARSILNEHLAGYRKRSYADLLEFVDTTETIEVRSHADTLYQLVAQIRWDDGSKRALRVSGQLGGIRLAFSLLPDGSSNSK